MIKKFLKHHPIHKKIVPSFDIIFLLRPTLFFSVWVMVVMGMYCARVFLNNQTLWISELSLRTFFIFLGLTLTCASTFILNQIEDVQSDKTNNKLFLVGNQFSEDTSLFISRVLLAFGLFVSIITNWLTSIFIIIIYVVWGILYNLEPYCWKRKPVMGWLSNILVGILLFMMGWFLILSNDLLSLTYFDLAIFKLMFPYLLCFASISLLASLPDVKGDAEQGDNTFPIVYGKKITIMISFILVIVSFILAIINNDPVASTSIITSIPFFIYCVFRRLDKDILRTIRYPIFILNFFALVIYPWLSVPLLITYFISKYYYWHRFNLHYPTFLVDND